MQKDVEFTWTPQHDQAMEDLKTAIINSEALIPIDYISSHPVFLAIDSSWRAVGWILSQQCEDSQRRPSRFGLIGWNDRESRYSQPKIELYGLFRALHTLHIHIVGITDLIVEMDTQYIRGMLNNPDVQPNAAMNQWITAIKLFNFKLVHVPAEKHAGPDGLSQHELIPGEDDDNGNPETWVDKVLSLGIWADTLQHMQHPAASIFKTKVGEVTLESLTMQNDALDDELDKILKLLTNGTLNNATSAEQDQITKRSKQYLARNG